MDSGKAAVPAHCRAPLLPKGEVPVAQAFKRSVAAIPDLLFRIQLNSFHDLQCFQANLCIVLNKWGDISSSALEAQGTQTQSSHSGHAIWSTMEEQNHKNANPSQCWHSLLCVT